VPRRLRVRLTVREYIHEDEIRLSDTTRDGVCERAFLERAGERTLGTRPSCGCHLEQTFVLLCAAVDCFFREPGVELGYSDLAY